MLHAAKQGHATVVQMLLARLESPEPLVDGSGRTALSHASEWGHHAVMTFLLASNKVHPNEESDIIQLPLFQAVKVPRASYKAIQLQVYQTSLARSECTWGFKDLGQHMARNSVEINLGIPWINWIKPLQVHKSSFLGTGLVNVASKQITIKRDGRIIL